MSRLRTWFYVLLPLLNGQMANAQSIEQQRERVQRFADQIRLLEHERAAQEFLVGDAQTVRSGALVFLTRPELVPWVQLAGDEAWRLLHRAFGDAALELEASGVRFVIDERKPTAQSTDQRGKLHVAVIQPDSHNQVMNWTRIYNRPIRYAGNELASYAAHVLTAPLQLPSSWRYNFGSSYDDELRVFIQLATGTPLQQQCVVGDNIACTRTLGFSEPVTSRRNDWRGWQLNVYGLRAHVVEVALRTGGVQSVPRYVAAANPTVGARLVAASGVTVDSLLSLWRADLVARAEPPNPRPAAGGAGIVLSVALIAFAARRRYVS
jgi:hypothetical protein